MGKMHKVSRFSLTKLLTKYPFRRSPRPIPSFILNSSYVSDPVLSPNLKIVYIPILKFQYFVHPISSTTLKNVRKFSGRSVPSFDQNKEIDGINLKFAEAREDIEMALESKETVYVDEEAECARAAVKVVLAMFENLMAKLPESDKSALQRSMGLKIEQLKAELEQLND